MAEIETTTLGAEGDECSECGVALATDQRYCLNCGTRRAGPRLDFMSQFLAAPGAAAEPAAATANGASAAAAPSQSNWSPIAVVGCIAVLGAMLLLGVLIGNKDPQAVQSQPADVIVQGGGGGSAADGATASTASDKGGDKSGKGGGDASSGKVPDTGNAAKVSDDSLAGLAATDPSDYSKASKNLPDTLATEGEPPKTDNKAPGGGSGGGTVIH